MNASSDFRSRGLVCSQRNLSKEMIMTRTTIATAVAGAILLSVRRPVQPLASTKPLSRSVPPLAGRWFPTARSSAGTTTRLIASEALIGTTLPGLRGPISSAAARTRRRLDKRAKSPRQTWRAGSSPFCVLESPQKELARRKIGKVFSSGAANIQPALTMPTDAG